MRVQLANQVVYLAGDWTGSAMTLNSINSLCDYLDLLERAQPGCLAVDMSGIERIDHEGSSFLRIWLSCLSLRGIRCEIQESPPVTDSTICDITRNLPTPTLWPADVIEYAGNAHRHQRSDTSWYRQQAGVQAIQ